VIIGVENQLWLTNAGKRTGEEWKKEHKLIFDTRLARVWRIYYELGSCRKGPGLVENM
jgi:hypothetical protein